MALKNDDPGKGKIGGEKGAKNAGAPRNAAGAQGASGAPNAAGTQGASAGVLGQDGEGLVLERILTLKQMIHEGRGGPLELHDLGNCYYLLGNYSQAEEYLGECLEKHPDYLEIATVHAMRIFCMLEEGRYTEARGLIAERLRLQADDVRLLSMAAYAEEKSGKLDASIETHRRVLKIDPDNANSLNSLGYLLTQRGRDEDAAEAFACLKKAVASEPGHPAYLDSLGFFLGKQGNKESAQRAFQKALRRAPRNAEILDHLKDVLE